MYAIKSKAAFFLIILSAIINNSMVAMHAPIEGIPTKEFSWPYYVQTRPEKGQFFEVVPYKSSPYILHRHNIHCSGHEKQSLYEACNASIAQLYTQTEEAKARNDYKLVMQLMRCTRVFEAYQDATCLYMSDLEQQLDSWEAIIKTFPGIDPVPREQRSFNETYEKIIEAYDNAISEVIKHAKNGNAHAYSIVKHICASQATDAQINAKLQKLLYEKGAPQEKKRACEYFVPKAQQGDLEACCYCAHSKLVGAQKEEALTEVLSILEQLASTEQGRMVLPVFAQLCEEKTIQFLASKKKDKKACAILGLIYNVRKDFAKAFSLLCACVDNTKQCPYLYYNLALLFKNGSGTSVDSGSAVGYLVKAIAVGADKALVRDIEIQLKEIVATNNVAAACELLLLRICGCQIDYLQVKSFWTGVDGDQKPYAEYMLKKNFPARLEGSVQSNNAAASALLASLHLHKACTADENKAIAELEASFACLERILSEASEVRSDLGKLALMLAERSEKLKDEEKALKYAQKAVDCKVEGAAGKLALLRMASSHATPEYMLEGAAAALKAAETCDNDTLRLIARSFVFGGKSQNGILFKRQPQEGYRLVNKLLKELPGDAEGLYMLGKLLYLYGGTEGIPANEDYAQECLIKVLDHAPVPLADDLIDIARTCFKKHEYDKAFEWLAKDSKSPYIKFHEGIFYMAAPAGIASDEKALACFDQCIRCIKVLSPDSFIRYLMQQQDNFITRIKRKAETDNRFLLVLLRFVRIYGLEIVGINKETALEYLNVVLQNKVPSAESFCARLYNEGILFEKSEEQAFLWSKKVLDAQGVSANTVDEAGDVMADLSLLKACPLAIKARYEMCRYFLNYAHDRKVAANQFYNTEVLLVNFSSDKELCEYARATGLWALMLQEAQRDNDVADRLAIVYANRMRLHPDLQWLDEIEHKGMPLLEKARGRVPDVNAELISDAYIMLARAVAAADAGKERCNALVAKAVKVKPGVIITDQCLAEYCGVVKSVNKIMQAMHANPDFAGVACAPIKDKATSNMLRSVLDIVQAMTELNTGRSSSDQKIKEQHYQAMLKILLQVCGSVAIKEGYFVDPVINSKINQVLNELEGAAECDEYLKKIFTIINKKLASNGFARN